MKNKLILVICATLATLVSCDSDDNIPQVPEPVFNEFCYGPNNDIFNSDKAFNYPVRSISPEVYLTPIQITDDNFMVNNDMLEGIGFLLEVNLYGNSAQGFQAGTYSIGDQREVADAIINYSLQYDTNATRNNSIPLINGQIYLEPYASGYIAEIRATDENGDLFHGIYYGNITPIP